MTRNPSFVSGAVAFLALATWSGSAFAQRVVLNPSNQTANSVSGGGNEAEYALIDANLTKPILEAAGFTVQVDQDFTNAPANANSWGADIFVSIHTNAGGGHGTETLYVSNGGQVLAGDIQNGLLSQLPYQSRGLKFRDNLHVLNATNMTACLTECVFHDCTATSGYQGHPPSESAFLKSEDGQNKIAAGLAAGVCAHFNKTCEPTLPPQTGNFVGVVYRAPNLDDVLAGAVVQIAGGPSATTGAQGDFSFALDPGEYTATATLAGYLPGSSTRTVVAGEDIWGSIGLEPDEPIADAGPEGGFDAMPFDATGSDVALDVAPSSPAAWKSEEASGCACSVPNRRAPGAPWGTALLAMALFVWRRRRTG